VNSGSGGGGGGTSTYRNYAGYTGASGIIIIAFDAFSGDVSSLDGATFRSVKQIVVTVTSAGKVTFYANSKKIANCINVPTTGSSTITATCNWSPTQRGATRFIAILTPTASPSNKATIDAGSVFVLNRTGKR
jgi:hypothetical protein